MNFIIDIRGTTLDLSWEPPALEQRNGVIRYYTLILTHEDGQTITFPLNNVTLLSLDEFVINTQFNFTLSASTSGGAGPTTTATATTDSRRFKFESQAFLLKAFYSPLM